MSDLQFKQTHVLTKAQRKALKAIYDRCPLWNLYSEKDKLVPSKTHVNPSGFTWGDAWNAPDIVELYGKPLTYRQFREDVVLARDCIMVRWLGMWLGIESDGYTHS